MPHPKTKGNLIGSKLKEIRKRQKMTQVQLSAALSVDHGIELGPDLISRIESGERSVRDAELLAFARVLETTTDSFFGEV